MEGRQDGRIAAVCCLLGKPPIDRDSQGILVPFDKPESSIFSSLSEVQLRSVDFVMLSDSVDLVETTPLKARAGLLSCR